MITGGYGEPGASPSSLHQADDIAGNNGSSFQHGETEGFATEAVGAAVTMDISMSPSITDVTLDQALVKLREIDRENVLLKEHLAENNKHIKRQFEVLRSLNIKDKEKVDKFKALISSLREEIKELQIKNMAHEETEKGNVEKLTTLENENALLQMSEQRLKNVIKHAEIQGLDGLGDMDDLPDISDAVLVASEDKEKEIETLEFSLAAKEETIISLRSEIVTVISQRDQYKMSNEVLFKDMDGLQKQKEMLDVERRQLHEQNTHLSKELDRLMQCKIACTRKEIEGQRQVVEEKKSQALDVSDFLNDPENLEDMFDQKVNLQEHEDANDRLKAELESERSEKLELEEQLQLITSELEVLKSQHALVREKMDVLEKEKLKMSREFEENLTSISHQRQENEKIQQAKVSEDQNALRSQVISLLGEVDELNSKLSLASMQLQQKDRRINELTGVNTDWSNRFDEQWHQSRSTIEKLQTQLSHQDLVGRQRTEEHNGTLKQYQSLQDNFNRLVTDYKDLLEMLENEKSNSQQSQQGVSKEVMENMDKMAAQVIAAEEAIKYRDTQLEDLKRKNVDMDDNIKLLHIQLETYQTDFQGERDARTKIAQEKNNLEEDVRNLQEKIKTLNDQLNHRQMEDIQRRVNQSQRPPSYTDAQRLNDYHQSMRDTRNAATLAQQQQMAYQMLHSGTQNSPHANNGTYRMPAANQGPQMSGYGAYGQSLNPASARAAFDDPSDNQYQSLTHDCPTCGAILPDTDSLELHVADCLDRQQRQQQQH